jgi:hypothetical protein
MPIDTPQVLTNALRAAAPVDMEITLNHRLSGRFPSQNIEKPPPS